MGKANGEAGADAAGGDPSSRSSLSSAAIPLPSTAWRAAVPAGGGSPSRRLRSTYFDTGIFACADEVSRCVREEGERLVQTLKSEVRPGAVLKPTRSRAVEAPVRAFLSHPTRRSATP